MKYTAMPDDDPSTIHEMWARRRSVLAKCGFEEIRIPELTQPSQTLVCIADFFITPNGLTVSDLVAFVTRHKRQFPDGLDTRIAIGDAEGNIASDLLDLQIDDGKLALLF